MTDDSYRLSKVERYQKKAEPFLLLFAVIFTAAFAWPIIDPEMSQIWLERCLIAQNLTWLAFVVDYGIQIYLAEDRRDFIATHLFDLFLVLIPIFRPLRLLRLMLLLRVLDRKMGDSLQGKVAWYAASSAVVIIFLAALSALDVERGAEGATITDFPTAVWWAMTTITTVGYGDTYPVTSGGRIVAMALMLCGIGLIGSITGTLATWLFNRVDLPREEKEREARDELRELRQQVASLQEQIERLAAAHEGRPGDAAAQQEAKD
ncbi:potassium channel family protein [Dermabacteraceae bacterium P13147]